MAYQKIPFTPDYGGVTADDMNHIQTQYDEAAADLNAHKSATPIDHPDGSVTLAKLAASAMTSAGGTEANRLARTNSSGRVGDSERLGGLLPSAFARIAQIDIFTASGTWVKPSGAKVVYVQVISGGGGGGGSGDGSSTSYRIGGGGGGGGGMVSALLPASTLPNTVSVIVGAGGTGGPNGQGGGNGGDSQFWNIKSIGGQGGQAVRTGGHGGGIRVGIPDLIFGPGSVGGAGASSAWSTVGGNSEYGGGGGGIGGDPSASPIVGTSGGSSLGGGGGGGGGASDHSSERTPGSGGTSILAGAGGQGGGWGGNGQNGTAPGGGGGGAGGYTSATSRRGGNGARGEVRVYAFF